MRTCEPPACSRAPWPRGSGCRDGLNLRDFERARLAAQERLVRRVAEGAVERYPGSSVEVEVVEDYANMRDHLHDHPDVLAAAEEAVRRAGLTPRTTFIRGGTDGSRLSERGLPTPKLFTGAEDIHSRHEWICVADLGAAVATIIHLAQHWATR